MASDPQAAYGRDGADSPSDPGGDIQLELRALDLAESEVPAQVVHLLIPDLHP